MNQNDEFLNSLNNGEQSTINPELTIKPMEEQNAVEQPYVEPIMEEQNVVEQPYVEPIVEQNTVEQPYVEPVIEQNTVEQPYVEPVVEQNAIEQPYVEPVVEEQHNIQQTNYNYEENPIGQIKLSKEIETENVINNNENMPKIKLSDNKSLMFAIVMGIIILVAIFVLPNLIF